MKVLVTGSAGHLGEALVRTLLARGDDVVGLDILPSAFTTEVASILDRDRLKKCLIGVDAVLHPATLHKPHLVTHSRREFIDTNVRGTRNLLEQAASAKVRSFVFTSSTSVFGAAMSPPPGAGAVWVTEDVQPLPKNIYGLTKLAAEDLCRLFHGVRQLSCIVLRTSRFFPEADDNRAIRENYQDENVKVNEYSYRRVDLADVVDAHLLAIEHARSSRFSDYIISATTPFAQDDLHDLRVNAAKVIERRVPLYQPQYAARQWKMFPAIERVYVNQRARDELGWRPRYDFKYVIDCLRTGRDFRSELATTIGSKGYHQKDFIDGPYPVSGDA